MMISAMNASLCCMLLLLAIICLSGIQQVSAGSTCDPYGPCSGEYCDSGYNCYCDYAGGASCSYQGGTVAGIVIAVIIGVCIIGCIIAACAQRRRRYAQAAYAANYQPRPVVTMTSYAAQPMYATSPIYAQQSPMAAIPIQYAYPPQQQQQGYNNNNNNNQPYTNNQQPYDNTSYNNNSNNNPTTTTNNNNTNQHQQYSHTNGSAPPAYSTTDFEPVHKPSPYEADGTAI